MVLEQIYPRQKELGQWMTPASVAAEMAAFAAEEDLVRVLDPSAGHGELLAAAAERRAHLGLNSHAGQLCGVEIDAEVVRVLSLRPGCEIEVITGNFFDFDLSAFDPTLVIANPPYGGNREVDFFVRCAEETRAGTLLVFLMPLAFVDRIEGVHVRPLSGRPLGVTTGHAIVVHRAGDPYKLRPVRDSPTPSDYEFVVHTGLKVYEEGGGNPPQTREQISSRVFSSERHVEGWLPCLRTGDITENGIQFGRWWVNYGDHLASPKTIERFTGPRLVMRRVPIWRNRRLCAVYTSETALCAGDLLVVKHQVENPDRLLTLAGWINSSEAAKLIHAHRPSVALRDSFPKISAKDVKWLITQGREAGAL